MRSCCLLSLALAACSAPDAKVEVPALSAVAEQPVLGPSDGVDHVLLWTREIEEDTRVLRDLLGFHVLPGGSFPNKVANRLATFSDETYLELLHFTVPVSEVDDATLKDNEWMIPVLAFLSQRDGSIGFGIRTSNLDRTAAGLIAKRFSVSDPSPGSYDPDGPNGPQPMQHSTFRTLGFEPSPIPGLDPFFVWYAPPSPRDASAQARWLARRSHPNTARGITAVWILTDNPARTRSALETMGFSAGQSFEMQHLDAGAEVLTNARTAIVVVRPRIVGRAADALKMRGPHVLGISVEVSELRAAQAYVERGYGRTVQPYEGGFGRSILAPSQGDLGLFVEFHATQ